MVENSLKKDKVKIGQSLKVGTETVSVIESKGRSSGVKGRHGKLEVKGSKAKKGRMNSTKLKVNQKISSRSKNKGNSKTKTSTKKNKHH